MQLQLFQFKLPYSALTLGHVQCFEQILSELCWEGLSQRWPDALSTGSFDSLVCTSVSHPTVLRRLEFTGLAIGGAH